MSMEDRDGTDLLNPVVGSEKRLKDFLRDDEVMPLLQEVLLAGATMAAITDQEGNSLWIAGEERNGSGVREYPISLEGEIVGRLIVKGETSAEPAARTVYTALMLLMRANLKRMLTSDVHMLVLEQSNAELLEINSRLAVSEKKYRELCEHLEEKVQERTMELERIQLRLFQQEKLASIGQLAAGIAHEINNPVGFVTSNLNTLRNYMSRSKGLLQLCRSAMQGDSVPPEFGGTFREQWKQLKLDQVLTDVDDLIRESLEGTGRVTSIVSNLRGVSHVDDSTSSLMDINEELDRTLDLLRHEIPGGTHIAKRFGRVPRLSCNPGPLSQALLNIILNALQSRTEGLEVVVTTLFQDGQLVIRVTDNGPGIPEAIINRVFEPFFTTKKVGSGMGLGLTMAHDIIVSHGGTIEVKGENGTTVEIRLPVRG